MAHDSSSLSSASAAQQRHGDIHVRYFRNTDLESVRQLFMLAMSNGPESPRRIALHAMFFAPLAYFGYASVLTAFYTALCSDSPKKQALSVAVIFLVACIFIGYRFRLSKMYTDHYNSCLVADLADIGSHYGMVPAGNGSVDFAPSGATAFWVVERVSGASESDGNGNGADREIIGCVGLDCRKENGVMVAEMRRLCVSPYYRRRGIASLLVRTVLRHAEEHQAASVVITTTHMQKQAISMYAKLGWVETNRIHIREALGMVETVLINHRLDLKY